MRSAAIPRHRLVLASPSDFAVCVANREPFFHIDSELRILGRGTDRLIFGHGTAVVIPGPNYTTRLGPIDDGGLQLAATSQSNANPVIPPTSGTTKHSLLCASSRTTLGRAPRTIAYLRPAPSGPAGWRSWIS